MLFLLVSLHFFRAAKNVEQVQHRRCVTLQHSSDQKPTGEFVLLSLLLVGRHTVKSLQRDVDSLSTRGFYENQLQRNASRPRQSTNVFVAVDFVALCS